ncbi:MAG: hypothetical protein IPK00_14410 [Deltaproteobacteria bacterium]|nr:hypothetical protein [Deltaproteobacteria bacterium]
MLPGVLAGALAVLALLGCDRNIEPYQPGEEPRAPDLARIFPEPPAGGPGAMGGGAAGAAGDAAGRSAFPPSRTEGAGGAADPAGAGAALAEAGAAEAGAGVAEAGAGDAAPISGRIELAPEAVSRQPKPAVLFVIARPQGATGGPPLAVVRIPDPVFPVDFEIGPADVMIPSMRFAGPIALSARLDADGNAMTRADGDLASGEIAPQAPGATGVSLVLGAPR